MNVVSWLTVRTAITIFRFFRSARSEATTLDFPLPVGASIMAIPPSRATVRRDFEHVALARAVFAVREVGVDAVHWYHVLVLVGFMGVGVRGEGECRGVRLLPVAAGGNTGHQRPEDHKDEDRVLVRERPGMARPFCRPVPCYSGALGP